MSSSPTRLDIVPVVVIETRPFFPTTIVGHRGAGCGTSASGARENTAASFAAAVAAGAQWIETDVRLTLDGHLVLAHDLKAGGHEVGLLTLAEALQAGAVDARVLDELPPHIGVDLEVKMSLFDIRSSGTHAAAARFLAERRGSRPWLLTSFDPSAQEAAATAGVPFGLLTGSQTYLYESVTVAARLGTQVAAVHEDALWRQHPDHPSALDCLAAARRAGLQLLVWGATAVTVSAAEELGLDAVCVDDVPATARALAVRPAARRRAEPAGA